MREKQRTKNRSLDELCEEVRRVEMALERISTKMHDPNGDIANTVRLSVFERELQAYLAGVKYAMGDEAIRDEAIDPALLKSTA